MQNVCRRYGDPRPGSGPPGLYGLPVIHVATTSGRWGDDRAPAILPHSTAGPCVSSHVRERLLRGRTAVVGPAKPGRPIRPVVAEDLLGTPAWESAGRSARAATKAAPTHSSSTVAPTSCPV